MPVPTALGRQKMVFQVASMNMDTWIAAIDRRGVGGGGSGAHQDTNIPKLPRLR